jgi:hypothetical protein
VASESVSAESVKQTDPWQKLEDYIEDHKLLLIDKNVCTKELEFKNGKILYDSVSYDISDLGWRSVCSRMNPPKGGKKKPPADYIRYLPMEMQEEIMAYHFKQIPKRRHFMRAKASDSGPFVRAFLSETYQRGRFDYSDYVGIVLNEFREKMPGFTPKSYHVGERIFHIKALSDVVITDPMGADLRVGMLFSDSEVGAGCVVIRPFVRMAGRYNDLFITSEGFRRKHTGARKQLGMLLTTDVLQGGVDTDKLRISRDIKDHIDTLVASHQTTTTASKSLILEYYDTVLPIEAWDEDSKETFFRWLWKRRGATALSKGHIKAAVAKMEDYDMANLWGLFNALCEVAQETDPEQRLEQEIAASRMISHLHAILT